jgi:hypothetical protein
LFEDPGASAELRDFVTLARNDGADQADLDRLARRIAPVVGVSAALIATSAAAVGTSAPLAAASAFGAPASGLTAVLGASAVANGAANAGALKAGASAVHASAVKAGLFSQLMASASAKVLAVGLSLGAAGAAVYGVRTSSDSERPPPGPAVPATQPSPRAAQANAAPQVPVRAEVVEVEEAAQVEPALAERVAAAPMPGAGEPRARKSLPVQRVAAEVKVAPSVAQAAPEVSLSETKIVDDPAAAAAKPVLPPPSELSLIERAEALRTQPSEALAFLSKHEEVYPRGALAQEREVLAIELLIKAGRLSQAERRAERFEDAHARSAHLPHIRALLSRARGE